MYQKLRDLIHIGFAVRSHYMGAKKYKVFRVFGIDLKFPVKITKNPRRFIKNNKPAPLDNSIEAPRKKVYFSIAAIFKDEPDLIEWIEYHRLAGVERFYLYDNESANNYEEILNDYISTGIVVYKKIPGRCMQKPAYKDALCRYKNETEWLAIIDLDEYIVPVQQNDIKDVLKEYDKYCGLVVNWVMFDSNGIEKRQKNKTVIDTFTRVHKNYQEPINQTIKSIVKPSKVRYINSVHACIYKNNELAVDENFNKMSGELVFKTKKTSIKKIRINHYHCKSKEDYLSKINKGFADQKRARPYDEKSLNFKSTTQDTVIQKYSEELNYRMKQKEPEYV
ncbi:MAG: glycosyltransferase family 92 protein [Candidatus Gastranaerophilales bacterium]|nr:glycosyltransferase family 92 protein [Candidatus Gastranaerophilales bacterium]